MDDLKDIFDNFNPELSSDSRFMSTLQQRMEAVELIKRNSEVTVKRNRIAVIAAAMSGFMCGVLVTLLFQFIADRIQTIDFIIPFFSGNRLIVDFHLISWLMAAAISGITAYNAYEITLSCLSSRSSNKY